MDAVIAPLGGGGLLSGIAAAVRGAAARRARLSRPNRKPRRRSRRRSRRASRAASTAGRPSFVDGAGGKSVPADDVAAAVTAASPARSSCRSTRSRAAMRLVADRVPRRSPKARPAAPSPRRSPRAARGTARSSRSSPAATSICRRFAHAGRRRARRCMTFAESQGHTDNFDAPTATRPHQPPRRARHDLWWSWNAGRAQRLPAARLPAVAADRAQPGADAAAASRRRRCERAAADPELLADLRRGDRARSTRRARRATRGGSASCPDAARAVDRLLLRRVRAAPVAADLRRRPRRAGRRSLQGSERPRRAAHRRRLHVSAGLLPPERHRRRLAAGGLREAQLGRRADRAGDHAGRQAVRHRGAARRPHRARRGVARARSAASSCTCSTPTSRRTRRGIASCRRASTAATARRASSRKSSSASAACARSGRWASTPAVWHLNEGHAAFVVLQRIRDLCETGLDASTRRSRRCGARRSSRRTRRCRPGTTRFRSTWSRRTWPARGATSAPYRERFLALGHYDNGGGPHVQHDGARAAHGGRGQRRQPAARRGHAADVAADLAGRARTTQLPVTSITNGVHVPTWIVVGDRRALRPSISAPTGASGTTTRRLCDRVLDDSGRGAVGGAAGAARVPLRLHPRARAPALDAGARRRGARRRRRARCSIRTR